MGVGISPYFPQGTYEKADSVNAYYRQGDYPEPDQLSASETATP